MKDPDSELSRYFRSVRIPLAVALGRIPIISGERERHDGMIKINQIGEVLTLYEALAGEFGVRLLFPLRHISDGHQIREILGFEWEEGKEQLGCVLSGNYLTMDGSVRLTFEQAVQYLETFACPATKDIIAAYLAGKVPDHLKIAAAGCLGLLRGEELMLMILNYSGRAVLVGHRLGDVGRRYVPKSYKPFQLK